MSINKIWDIVDLFLGMNAIKNKWVLNIKLKTYGSIDHFKAHLVYKWYMQREVIDYD